MRKMHSLHKRPMKPTRRACWQLKTSAPGGLSPWVLAGLSDNREER